MASFRISKMAVVCSASLQSIKRTSSFGAEEVMETPMGLKKSVTPRTDHFLGIGYSLPDDSPHALKYALYGLGLRGDVLFHRPEISSGHRNSSFLRLRFCCANFWFVRTKSIPNSLHIFEQNLLAAAV